MTVVASSKGRMTRLDGSRMICTMGTNVAWLSTVALGADGLRVRDGVGVAVAGVPVGWEVDGDGVWVAVVDAVAVSVVAVAQDPAGGPPAHKMHTATPKHQCTPNRIGCGLHPVRLPLFL